MEVRKQKSGEERIKEQSASETVCFAWGNRFCSFQRHKNKPRFFWFVFSSMEKMNKDVNVIETWTNLLKLKNFSIQFSIENHSK
ncbi:hypothetical protein pgond44_09591 [Psychroflexus gondwanensis ACAM 44]|uniref:Uncharacterized protein n=1 Tax=Psychroflexus gondwanensis ACAM 44 TaxID=1189619 RepID=N1WPA2_9FLAO|nr:hypothetical protein pgond44_09591 [Psychroflexus gondwanensis ACAM 44]